MRVIMIMFGCLAVGVASLWGLAYARQLRAKAISKWMPNGDLVLYAGKYVLTDGFRGPVVASGQTPALAFDEAAAMDAGIRDRLVCLYVPKSNERLKRYRRCIEM